MAMGGMCYSKTECIGFSAVADGNHLLSDAFVVYLN
jgi:hypothetical protein